MSRECGGVERFVTFRCEQCGRGAREGELHYHKPSDEYWCEDCLDREIEERDPSMPHGDS